MGDLLKDLARTRPSTPDVDPERMERDLARIVSLPRSSLRREWNGEASLKRWLVPALVATAVVALVVVTMPPGRPAQLGTTRQTWHVLSRLASLMVVGDAGNPYVVRFASETDRWLAAEGQVTISQLNATVAPFEQADADKWTAAGRPGRAKQVGGNHEVRIGPVKPAVSKTNYADFWMSLFDQVRFDTLATLKTDPDELRRQLQDIIVGNKGFQDEYRVAVLAMGLMSANVTADQRNAAFELLTKIKGMRQLGTVTLPNGRSGAGVALRGSAKFQFSDVETQLVIDPRTRVPIIVRDVITSAQHGLPAGTSVSEEEFVVLEQTSTEPLLPTGVPVNGEVESPIVTR